jgi:hypothetical protein
MDLPIYIKGVFGDFYRAMFDQQVKREQMSAVFPGICLDMGWCDPCAADPLSADELRKLGVFWVEKNDGSTTTLPSASAARPSERLHHASAPAV